MNMDMEFQLDIDFTICTVHAASYYRCKALTLRPQGILNHTLKFILGISMKIRLHGAILHAIHS